MDYDIPAPYLTPVGARLCLVPFIQTGSTCQYGRRAATSRTTVGAHPCVRPDHRVGGITNYGKKIITCNGLKFVPVWDNILVETGNPHRCYRPVRDGCRV
jgi:hypothetical protein